MKRRNAWKLAALAAAVIACGSSLTGQNANRTSAEFRKKFIEEFHRTGMATTPADAMLLRILVQARNARRGVEVGTERGFGAINMGIGFERTGGHLYTLEINPRRAAEARENLKKVGLEKVVTVVQGDALEELPKLEGKFDFVFLDAAKSQYLGYLKALEPKLEPGAVIVADNVIRFADGMRDFLDYIQNSPDYESVVIRASLEKNDGMLVAYRLR